MASTSEANIEKQGDMSIIEPWTYSDNVTSSFLLSNLHCPSCVSHIQELLSRLQPRPISISPSLLSSWVTVQHDKNLRVRDIREALIDAGFDVCDITSTPDADGTVPSALSSMGYDGEIGYLDRFIDRLGSDRPGKNGSKAGPSIKHLQNCEACRREVDVKKSSSTSNFSAPQPSATSLDRGMRDGSNKHSTPLVVVDSDESKDVWRASLAVGGMTCAVCVNTISQELGQKDWVQNVVVNLISNSANVDFVGEQHKNDIVEAIEDIGYEATIDSVVSLKSLQNASPPSQNIVRTVEIMVEGMFCGHCPTRVLSSLEQFGSRVEIQKPPTVEDPILKISYTPLVPNFTVRNIMKAISDTNPLSDDEVSFKTSIYHPPTLEERSRRIHERERRRILVRVIVTLIVAIPTLIIGIVYMSLVPSNNPGREYLMRPLRAGISRAQWALFILATPIYFFCADVFHVRALKEVRAMWRPGSSTPILQRFYRFGSMNMLMSLGTSIAYFSSVAQLIAAAVNPPLVPDNNSFYFDSVVFLTLFLLVGRLIEAYSKSKTGDAVQMLGKLRPTVALLVESGPSNQDFVSGEELANGVHGESLKSINVDLLEYGDTVKILHGGSPPCDGTIIDGETTFDESSLTGESKLIKKSIGNEVFSGTVNKESPISIKITGVAGSSMLDQIVKAVREGQTRRAPMERLADTLTGYFVPFVTLIAIVTWIVWLSLGYSGTLPHEYLDNDAGSWVAWSLQFAIAVFVVACPCGLALAAPTALFVGGGLAAKQGILVKGGGEAFEKASKLDCIVFDKTGTLTMGGEPSVTNFHFSAVGDAKTGSSTEKEILGMVQRVEENSSHTVAKAIESFCKTNDARCIETAERVTEIGGKGMRASFVHPEMPQKDMIIGNEGLMADNSVSIPADFQAKLDTWKSEGKSVALAAILSPGDKTSEMEDEEYTSSQLVAIFAISDPIRPESPAIIHALQKRGMDVWMLSGDNQVTANAIGLQVGILPSNIIAGVLPSEKADKIQYLQRSLNHGNRAQERAVVAMVGDGINDSPALTIADVGIAIGSGSDIAISSAEFVLVSSNLNSLITLLDLSKVIFRRIKFNFGWALVYNLVALPVAAGVLYPVVSNGTHVRLDPVWASLAMAMSSISVVCSSLALRSKIPGVGFKSRAAVSDVVM